ncbi:PP2C-domain-containing protein [Thelephora ganbajun]|uniref:PP2C-domain-containing protein n=1 Tax=Thelephora ganbajun TaxID=370292 RepID=A0ACB6ZA66_THEGA|nr:PP2C-domain-containing protein [Thelephora ganbajun]
MEDAHTAELQLDEDNRTRNAFFAVYDGHGGASVAKYAGKNAFKRLAAEESYMEGSYHEGLKRTFLGIDDDILKNPDFVRDPSGCTAVAALITEDDRIFVANAGDSRCVLGTKGESKPLSFDHKPNNEVEMARIFRAGGYVEYGRVNGNLALARALGDFDYKKNANVSAEDQIITANPEIIEHKITKEDEFLIIACDGIWDCLTSQQCVDVVRLLISEGKELSEIAEIVCELCLAPDTESGAGIGCDNMTMLVVALLNGKTKEEWGAWVTDRVKNHVGHATPEALPQLYSQSRLMAFKAKRAAEEAREKDRQARLGGAGGTVGFGSPGFGITRILGSTGGISFHPGGNILADSGALMFADEDTDSDDSDDMDGPDGQSFFSHTFGLRRNPDSVPPNSANKSLKEQLDILEQHLGEKNGESSRNPLPNGKAEGSVSIEVDTDQDSLASEPPTTPPQKSETPPPPKPLPNGDTMEQKPHQFTSMPGSDEAAPVVKAEGLMDMSEDPLKG